MEQNDLSTYFENVCIIPVYKFVSTYSSGIFFSVHIMTLEMSLLSLIF